MVTNCNTFESQSGRSDYQAEPDNAPPPGFELGSQVPEPVAEPTEPSQYFSVYDPTKIRHLVFVFKVPAPGGAAVGGLTAEVCAAVGAAVGVTRAAAAYAPRTPRRDRLPPPRHRRW